MRPGHGPEESKTNDVRREGAGGLRAVGWSALLPLFRPPPFHLEAAGFPHHVDF